MEEKQESGQRTERDKHSGGMEIEPTMKWRLRNMELRQGGSGGGRGGTESLFLETGKLHTAKKHIVTLAEAKTQVQPSATNITIFIYKINNHIRLCAQMSF